MELIERGKVQVVGSRGWRARLKAVLYCWVQNLEKVQNHTVLGRADPPLWYNEISCAALLGAAAFQARKDGIGVAEYQIVKGQGGAKKGRGDLVMTLGKELVCVEAKSTRPPCHASKHTIDRIAAKMTLAHRDVRQLKKGSLLYNHRLRVVFVVPYFKENELDDSTIDEHVAEFHRTLSDEFLGQDKKSKTGVEFWASFFPPNRKPEEDHSGAFYPGVLLLGGIYPEQKRRRRTSKRS